MTGDQLRTTVRELVGVDSSYTRLTDTNINNAVLTAMQKLAIEAEPSALVTSYSQATSAADATYEGNAVALRIYGLRHQDVWLKPVTFSELNRDNPSWASASNGTPKWYVVEGVNSSGYPKFRLIPTPATADTLTLYYLAEPTAVSGITTAEIVQWPKWTHDGFAAYAAWRNILRFSERGIADPRAAAIKAEWDEMRAEFLEQTVSGDGARWGTCTLESGAHDIGIETPWS